MLNFVRLTGTGATLVFSLMTAAAEFESPPSAIPYTDDVAPEAAMVEAVRAEPALTSGVLIAAVAAGGGECSVGCLDMYHGNPECEDLEHLAPTAGNYAQVGGGSHNETCFPGNCNCDIIDSEAGFIPAKHPYCPTSPGCEHGESLAMISQEDQKPESLARAFLALGPETVHLVPERGAVQLSGCDGALNAHIPVSHALLDMLATHQATQHAQ